MSTPKRDPVLAVLDYFETADLPLAHQALTLAKAILKRRGPQGPPKRHRPKPAKREADGSLSLN
jgi:hypothetical protein